VRTPWTLASDRVSNDTHRLATMTLVNAGIGGGLVVIGALIPAVYSLVHYKRLEACGEL